MTDQVPLTIEEVQNWIKLLYQDLLKDNVLIGGYYFTFKNLQEFEGIKNQMEEKSKDLIGRITKLSKIIQNSADNEAQLAQNELYNKLSNLKITLKAKNKFGQYKNLECTLDEFKRVYKELTEAKKDIEYFRDYSLQELQTLQTDEIPCFMWFLNDLLNDLRAKFSGRQRNKKPLK